MIIRRREKPLTPQEALNRARQEKLVYWFGSEPLMTAALINDKVSVFPLDPTMSTRPWLLAFVDPDQFACRDVFNFAGLWGDRYKPQNLGVIFVIKTNHVFERSSDWGRAWADHRRDTMTAVLDADGLLAKAFQVEKHPKILLSSGAKLAAEHDGASWFEGAESDLQRFFRSSDPGLPLYPVMKPTAELARDLGPIDAVEFQGKWEKADGAWSTVDPTATMRFKCFGNRLGITARSKTEQPAKIMLELGRDFSRETVADEDMHLRAESSSQLMDPSEKRRTEFTVNEARFYFLFKKLPSANRDVTLRFPTADRTEVTVFGVYSGD